MGKRYHCIYCDAFLAATPSAIRTHCGGLAHQRLRSEHYQRYKSVETILSEESTKKPCLKFAHGECLFGGKCRFSHYTRDQIQFLKNQVAAKSHQNETKLPSFQFLYERLQIEKSSQTRHQEEGTTIYCDKGGHTTVCPWSYPMNMDSSQDSLPPSLKKIMLEDFISGDISEWG